MGLEGIRVICAYDRWANRRFLERQEMLQVIRNILESVNAVATADTDVAMVGGAANDSSLRQYEG